MEKSIFYYLSVTLLVKVNYRNEYLKDNDGRVIVDKISGFAKYVKKPVGFSIYKKVDEDFSFIITLNVNQLSFIQSLLSDFDNEINEEYYEG